MQTWIKTSSAVVGACALLVVFQNCSPLSAIKSSAASSSSLNGNRGDTGSASISGCFKWSAGSLQEAVNTNKCVEVQEGTFELSAPVIMPSGHTIRGVSSSKSILKAIAATWQFHGGDSLVASVDSTDVHVSNLTLDGSGIATYAVAARGMTVENNMMIDTRCSGVGIAGVGMVIKNNVIKRTARTTVISGRGAINCASGGGGVAEGAGIYAEGHASSYNPIIAGNTISETVGPALDINGVWGGTFSGNKVFGNTAWAGASFYGASRWIIENNDISHPADEPPQPYHPHCAGGPGGVGHSAALFFCQDTDDGNLITTENRVSGNRLSGYFGILAVGANSVQPYLVPRFNNFSGNNLAGSNVGCADDFTPGQWQDGANTWTNNNCSGTANTGPVFF